MTATMTTFVAARIDTARRAGGTLRPKEISARSGHARREGPSRSAPRPRHGTAGVEAEARSEPASVKQVMATT
jgi:hypothetical protein